MERLRRTLLEIWIIPLVAGVVGFMGPFGTYLMGDFLTRALRWEILLMGAYVLVRPTMVFWNWVADATRLPRGTLMVWGLSVSSIPMGLIWQAARADELKQLGGYAGVLPFSWLCALTILLVTWLANRADEHLLANYGDPMQRLRGDGAQSLKAAQPVVAEAVSPIAVPPSTPAITDGCARLYARLGPQFHGTVLALESEDHYVRVHGMQGSALLLMRLRDAIAEMDGAPGEQTHRSWWIARDAIAHIRRTGRTTDLELVNGTHAPVARDSVDRLERSGFLKAAASPLS
ncbi:LytTR family transcriptional regulator DNA-binding domain-containing protein [Sphingobium sufflavum]|uniref:LytTR family DNA-binding domain-containing protein n=1 Tax=Sphingobium sufflavum TaxID=1129547 RepID=UPI001F1B6B60|nr:LytTR family DNA-binding domain-containing protein [Sphingobium sufflavum]MCE7795756.1 LytTR family transcriptional regulator DNA-binding domain-containing protein [Sphingobium sufflavum]